MNGHESYIVQLKSEEAADAKSGADLTFGKKFRNFIIATYDFFAASKVCALCCETKDAAKPKFDSVKSQEADVEALDTTPAPESAASTDTPNKL